jgi:hypothetical protein
MKYVDEFRDQALARQLAAAIAAEVDPGREYRLMEFCGGHTHAIFRYGVQQLMPPNLRFVHGPGCPVCVLPMARLDQAIAMTHEHGVTLCTYGDLMRVPASGRQTLLKAKAAGADVRMIYSTLRRAADRRATNPSVRWSSSPSASKPPLRPPRWSLSSRRAIEGLIATCRSSAITSSRRRRMRRHPGRLAATGEACATSTASWGHRM